MPVTNTYATCPAPAFRQRRLFIVKTEVITPPAIPAVAEVNGMVTAEPSGWRLNNSIILAFFSDASDT